jgi:hypothetical protein
MKNAFDAPINRHCCLATGQKTELSPRLHEICNRVPKGVVTARNNQIDGQTVGVATPPLKLWHYFLSQKITKAMLILLAAGSLAVSLRAQDDVYAVEFNQANNRFGILDLLTGNFTQISDLGGTIYNDIAYNPVDGSLYGIQGNCANLVKLDKTSGEVTTIAPFNVSGIESLAFQPESGVLFGCAQSGLYTINLLTGEASFVGTFGTPYNLNLAQNIRFDTDGKLYLSNTSDNTDIYRVSTEDGSATFVGEATGYADLILMNAGQYMYGVSIPAINGAVSQPELLSFDLNTFVNGGTNADGSIHQITVTLVGGGPAFPVNFDFSGVVPAVIPPPWAPTLKIATQTDGNAEVTASGGRSAQIYVFQSSTDMANWTSISTNTADTNGTAVYVDLDAKNCPGRFYRTETP